MSRARHDGRLLAVQFIFQRDFNHNKIEDALADFWTEERTTSEAIRTFSEMLIHGVEEHRVALDAKIEEYAVRWSTKRMNAVDRNVMRVAVYEMQYCPDIPPVVSINEAVDIAKELSGDESGKFVNGILDKAMRELKKSAKGVS